MDEGRKEEDEEKEGKGKGKGKEVGGDGVAAKQRTDRAGLSARTCLEDLGYGEQGPRPPI